MTQTRPTLPAARVGGPAEVLTDEQVRAFVLEQLGAADLDGRSVCVIVPDGTRSCPMPLLLGAVHEALHGRVTRLTVLVALGTHARMGEAELARHLGYPLGGFAERYPGATVRNHEWWDPHTFASVGTIGADRIAELSEGRLRQPVQVRLNRAVVEHDLTLVVGPVFPHEVVGFSGGITYALFSFTRKLGQAVGGALAAFIIGAGGYVGGVAAQSQSAINAIRFASGFAPAIFILIGIAIFFRYPLTEQTFATMVAETAARRAERAAGTHPTPE